MRKVMKKIVTIIYKPFLERYLSKTRKDSYENIRLIVPPDVFHPGFFHSTSLLVKHIKNLGLENKIFLELGAGSGLISIVAAKRKAIVTASDINPIAIDHLKTNAVKNNVTLHIIHSNMFENIPLQIFQVMIINPPFYKRNPETYKDHAWYCGDNGEFFQNLFEGLSDYSDEHSHIAMILSEDCDLQMISSYAAVNYFKMTCIEKHRNFMEQNFIYKIEPVQQK